MKIVILVAALLLAACAPPPTPPVADPLPRTAGVWTEFTPQPVVLDGETVTPTCSGAPGADPTFKFWAKRGTSNRLVVYFDGGGACWNDATCSRPHLASTEDASETLYKAELLPSDNPAQIGGLFDLTDARNPTRDWSFVFVPYCTADVHSGSNTATYTDPTTHERYTIQHRGVDNFRVVLAWMRANFGAQDEILVTGSSAGAYGAAAHFARIRDAFPGGRGVMLGDAGQGVVVPEFNAERDVNWRVELPEQIYGPHVQPADQDLVADLATHYPHDRFAQYTTAYDRTQIGFFALMRSENACTAWSTSMMQGLTARERAPNFHAYLAAGEMHTILRRPEFYTESSGGAPFSQWLGTMLSDDAGWQNQSCTNCATPPRGCGTF